jgi:membrane-associated phospholipid phosphatase
VTFSILMGLSRAYLAAHWLSDAVAGVLLGTSCALTAALVVGLSQRWWQGTRRRPAGAHRMAGVPPPDEVAGRRRTA